MAFGTKNSGYWYGYNRLLAIWLIGYKTGYTLAKSGSESAPSQNGAKQGPQIRYLSSDLNQNIFSSKWSFWHHFQSPYLKRIYSVAKFYFGLSVPKPQFETEYFQNRFCAKTPFVNPSLPIAQSSSPGYA